MKHTFEKIRLEQERKAKEKKRKRRWRIFAGIMLLAQTIASGYLFQKAFALDMLPGRLIFVLGGVLIVLLAALIFASSCTPFRPASPPEAATPSPTLEASPDPTTTPSPSLTVSPSPTPEPTSTPYEGDLIVQYALQFDGYRYNYGGQDPSTGFDCSGLVYYVFKQFGYKLNRVAADQALNGIEVKDREDLLPGDLVCFSWITSSYINHVGIYIGDGKFIHAMDSANDVLVTSLDEYLKTHRCIMRRIVGAEDKKTLAQIEERERRDAEALAMQMAEEERIAAEQAKNASPTTTPPPAYIPDTTGGMSKEEAEAQHRKEIEDAWREIWGEESSSAGEPESPADSPEESGADTPTSVEPPAGESVPAEPSRPEPVEPSVPDSSPAEPSAPDVSPAEPSAQNSDSEPEPEFAEDYSPDRTELPPPDEFTIRISG